MTRVGRWMIGIRLFITVGLIPVQPGHPASQEGHTPEQDATICTLETLNGRYLFGGIATLFSPAFGVTQPSQLAFAGYHLFNGDGTETDTVFMPTVMPFD